MKIYTTNKFTAFYPVSPAAVVVANNKEEATRKLNECLLQMGLKGDVQVEDMSLMKQQVRVFYHE